MMSAFYGYREVETTVVDGGSDSTTAALCCAEPASRYCLKAGAAQWGNYVSQSSVGFDFTEQ